MGYTPYEQRTARILAILMAGARAAREREGHPFLTEWVRASFDEERPAFLQLAKEFMLEEKLKRHGSAEASQQKDSDSEPTHRARWRAERWFR